MSLIASIKRDIQAALDRDPAAVSKLQVIFTYPGFHARLHHRVAHTMHRKRMQFAARLVSYASRFVTGQTIMVDGGNVFL